MKNRNNHNQPQQHQPQQSKQEINLNKLRQQYLGFMQQKQHTLVPSVALVPENDPTTLFTTAGMQPMMPYLLGAKHPQGTRIANAQQCLRAEDIEEVGDNRHTTFFEMLGNWSLGDYFKKEQLTWFFEFLTQELGLDPKRLYVTAFAGSQEFKIEKDLTTVKIWQELFANHGIEDQAVANAKQPGVQGGRIFFYQWENWWSRAGAPENMPVGEPGGPDSEVFYDFGPELKLHENSPFKDQPCHVNCDCGRFLEIGNSVFMQQQKTESGFKQLQQKNIDFGGGLERILAACQDQPDIFQTQAFTPLIETIQRLSQVKYEAENKAHYRVIADHLKAAVMLINDGVKPDNKEQGYILRRLIRRAIRHGKLLEIDQAFTKMLVEPVVELYAKQYPRLAKQQAKIEQVLTKEEAKFERTLNRGLKEFAKAVQTKQQLTGELAFKLYETYGFPLEMSLEEAQRQKLTVAKDLQQAFFQQKKEHAAQSRAGAKQKFSGGLADQAEITTAYHTATHLLLAALNQVLGTNKQPIKQQGSNITADRLRFDFNYPQALTAKQQQTVIELVNNWIKQDLPVSKEVMAKEKALAAGATAQFADRYPDQVTVYTIGQPTAEAWVSKELCGGPHVAATGEIPQLEIYKEKSAAAGVRRLYARAKKINRLKKTN